MTFMKGKGILQPINSHIPDSMEANEKFVNEIKVEEKSCFVGKWAGELGQLVREKSCHVYKCFFCEIIHILN